MGWLMDKPYPRKDERITTEKNASGLEISRVLAKKACGEGDKPHAFAFSRRRRALYGDGNSRFAGALWQMKSLWPAGCYVDRRGIATPMGDMRFARSRQGRCRTCDANPDRLV